MSTWYNVLGELSKTLARTGGSRLVGSSSQVDILKSRGGCFTLNTLCPRALGEAYVGG